VGESILGLNRLFGFAALIFASLREHEERSMKKFALAAAVSFAALGGSVSAALACPAGTHQVIVCVLQVQGVCIKYHAFCLPNT
jgi:hypothetical protein